MNKVLKLTYCPVLIRNSDMILIGWPAQLSGLRHQKIQIIALNPNLNVKGIHPFDN